MKIEGDTIREKVGNLRRMLDLPPNACLICGKPVQDWKGTPTFPSHNKCANSEYNGDDPYGCSK